MNKTINNESSLDILFRKNPLEALKICAEWIQKMNEEKLEEKKQTEKQIKEPPAQKKYMTVKEWVLTYGYIPEGGIRHLIFSNPDFNRRVVKRLGKKILLDVQELDLFISQQGNA